MDGKEALVQLKHTMQGGLNTGICHSIAKGGYISSVMELSVKPPAFSTQMPLHNNWYAEPNLN